MDLLNTLLEKKKVAQDKDIKDREGTQPSKYYAKDAEGDDMAKSTKQARARHFDKGTKKDDDDPSAYEPAPGDKSAKTKKSQHTKKFAKMYGESLIAQQLSGLVMGEQLEEGKMVAPASRIIKRIADEIQYKMQDLYTRRQIDGVKLINQIAQMVGMTVSDKMQKKGTLFSKNG
jgi:hypothetical protein